MQNVTRLIGRLYKKPLGGGQRQLDLEKVFSELQVGLENEEPLYKACINAGIPFTACYENFNLGKDVAEKITSEIKESRDEKKKSTLQLGFTDREIEQLDFYYNVERAKNNALMRGKKYISYTLSQAEQDIERHKQAEIDRIAKIEREGGSDDENKPTPFIADPETLKLIKWLLERRERDRYATKTEVEADGSFTFKVEFEDLPPRDLTEDDEN